MDLTSTRYKWWVVFMLWLVCFFNYADRQAIFAVFPTLKEEFGFDSVQLGVIGSAFMWVYAFGAPAAGLVCDRVRRKDLILGGCLFWSFVTVTTGWCSKLWHFVTVRALEGFGETFYFPASMSLVSDYHDARTRSRALSFHQSSVYLGTILGSWVGAWFAEHVGWRFGFYLFGGLGMVLAAGLYRFLREPRRGEADSLEGERNRVFRSGAGGVPAPRGATGNAVSLAPETAEPSWSPRTTIRFVFRSPAVPLLMLAFVGANFVATIFLTWTPTFLVEKFGFRLASAGLSGTVFIHLASAASVPIAGAVADRLTRRFSGGRMLVQALGLLAGAGFVVLVGRTGDRGMLIVAMTAFGLCKGFYDSGIFASLYDVIDARARGTAAGLMNTVGWGGGALGPVFVGWVSKYGSQPTEVANMSDAIAFGGIVYLVAATLVLAAMWTASRRATVKV